MISFLGQPGVNRICHFQFPRRKLSRNHVRHLVYEAIHLTPCICVVADKSLVSAEELEAYRPDQEVLEAREQRRQNTMDMLFSVIYQEAAEIERKDSKKKFHQTILDIAAD